MRSNTFSSLAFLASTLLVKEAFASPLGKRAVVTDKVIVTEEIIVTQLPDGSYKTGAAEAIGTLTVPGSVIQVVKPVATVADVPASSAAPPAPATTAASSKAPAVFIEQPKPTTTAAAKVVDAAQVKAAAPVSQKPATTSQAPASSTTPAASATSASSGGSPSGAKRGVAYNDASFLSAFTSSPLVSWCYNWGATTPDVPSEFEFVPMLWGLGSHADNWEANANKAIGNGAKHLLAFNEPDHGEQSSLSVSDAVNGYKTHMQPFAGKAKLGSPAVTNGGAPMGLTWLSGFMDSCSDCTIDFIAIHWYNGGSPDDFKDYVGRQAKAVANGRPIWITEFQAPGSTDEQTAWLAEVLPWLDSQDYVERYSLFMASEGNMMSGTGLSAIGKAFVA